VTQVREAAREATADGAERAEIDALLVELLLTPEGRRDPYPRYRAIRERAPVHKSALELWVVSRFDDCQQVLRHPQMGKSDDASAQRLGLTEAELAELTAGRMRQPSLLFLNPPDHTRLRSLVQMAFTPRTVEELRPHIARLTDELLDSVEDLSAAGPVDVMQALAFPLPVTVIGEMLGIPPADRPAFQPLVRAGTTMLEFNVNLDQMRAAAAANDEMVVYFEGLVAERRRQPRGDLLSELIGVEEAGDRLAPEELISTAILLFAAGFETTTNLIGNGLYALLRHPAELARLRASPDLARLAVEEMLRWDSPVQLDGRTAFADVVIGGELIGAGDTVVTLLGAANRDPARFPDPDRFDVGRDDGPPMSFGSGIHYCLGAALARVEGQVVFERLLARFAAMELAGEEPDYRPGLTLRGLTSLLVAFQPA